MSQNIQQRSKPIREDSNAFSIGWKNLQYEVVQFSKLALKKKTLLRGLNGHFKKSTLNGLMGPSGAGKTTLLRCFCEGNLSGLSEHSNIYTNIPQQSSVLSCYIEQHVLENIFGKMSVRDILQYAFRLKNSTTNTNRATMAQHIDKILHQLMLPADLLEQDFEQCSGGQQKRIAIGQELMSLSMPAFLFVDEPSTGLDTVSSFEVINCLKQLTLNHRITVIVSIHAPNNETLKLFDQIYVLAKGGVAIYSGAPSKVESYPKKEIQLDIPARQPPIEALMKIACNGINGPNVVILTKKMFHT